MFSWLWGGHCTVQLAQTSFEFIALFHDLFSAFVYKCVEFNCELGHAFAEVIEGKVNAWKLSEWGVGVRVGR